MNMRNYAEKSPRRQGVGAAEGFELRGGPAAVSLGAHTAVSRSVREIYKKLPQMLPEGFQGPKWYFG